MTPYFLVHEKLYIVNNIPLHILTNTPKLTICEWLDTETNPNEIQIKNEDSSEHAVLLGLNLVAIVMIERIDDQANH